MRDLVRLAIWFPLRWLLSILPLGWSLALCHQLGWLGGLAARRRRRIAETELRLLLGEQVAGEEAARAGVGQSIANLLTTALYPRLCPENVERVVRLEGAEHLRTALAEGRGVVLLLAHYGFNQLAMAPLGHGGFRVHQIGATPMDWHRLTGQRTTRVQEWTAAIRLRLERTLPSEILYIQGSMRPAVQLLREGGCLLMAFDGRAGSRFLSVPMARRTMAVSTGPFSLARLTDAVIIPIFMELQDDRRHLCRLLAPLPEGEGDRTRRYQEQAEAFAELLAERVRHRPDHYAALLAEARLRAHLDDPPLWAG